MADEINEQVIERLKDGAGHIIEMFKSVFNTPRGMDGRRALTFTAALAGHACHQAVKAEHGTFAVVTTNDGRNFYFGDDLNKYLLENDTNVVGHFTVVSGVGHETVLQIVKDCVLAVGKDEHTVCGFDPNILYKEISECWDGIFENMTSKYCEKPSEWPVLFGIVAQNILQMSIKGGAPKDEAGMVAIESAVYMSKMDFDSVKKKDKKPAEKTKAKKKLVFPYACLHGFIASIIFFFLPVIALASRDVKANPSVGILYSVISILFLLFPLIACIVGLVSDKKGKYSKLGVFGVIISVSGIFAGFAVIMLTLMAK